MAVPPLIHERWFLLAHFLMLNYTTKFKIMDDKSKKSHTDDHNQLPSDEVTRNKIDKHLSDIDDTISEEDIKNINTVTGAENNPAETHNHADEENEINKDDKDDDDEPEKEAPTPWEILGE